MKHQNIRLTLLLSLLLIYQINSLSNLYHEIIHVDSEFAKVCTLDDENVLVLSSIRGLQKTKESKLDKKGNVVYGNSTLNFGYSGSAELIQPHSVNGSQPEFLLSYHNKQNLNGKLPNEFTTEFKQGTISRTTSRGNSLYTKKSSVALKNGKVILTGINKSSGYNADTTVDVNIFDPLTNKNGAGVSFTAQSNYISCFELKENDIYCIYVSCEHQFVSRLSMKHISVNSNAMTLTISDLNDKKVIKTFYTDFNFVKAIPFNEKEALVLFQTGNNNKKISRYGNSGKDLYFYHLEVSPKEFKVKRYEYLYDECKYNENPEDYNADIAVLSKNRIYVACETDSGTIRGFVIYPDKSEWEEFNFNKFEGESMKNPVFSKFDKSLGIFYTLNTVNENARVAYHLMNYPDCDDYRNIPILLPRHRTKDDFDFSGKVFMNNPYPASRANEEVKLRFESFSNISLVNLEGNKEIESGKDYTSKLNLKISPNEMEGIYSIEYTATRNDSLDGLIEGRTCKINFNTPKCLDRCDSCTRLGDNEHHYCLGCANEKYYKEEDNTTVNEGWGKPHNCPNCNISCSTCHGAAYMNPKQTTNCKTCDYASGYYHYFLDERTCISYETQDAWEEYLNQSIYLDTSPGPNNKENWRWKHCHSRCKKCHLPGTDENNNCDKCKEEEGFYFWCNQTIGNGIPGSCHDDCVDNGFFLKESEGMKKCCPCLPHCQKCPNETLCDNCFPPFFNVPDKDKCVEKCDYCLAEDRQLWECVNCKTRYDVEKYNMNGTCVDKIPFIEFLNRYHHIVDEKCNLLQGCKEGCFKCDNWYTEHCTQCFPEFYKEDFFGLQHNKTFRCFKEKECQGIEPYQFDVNLPVGGVPRLINEERVCYNCRLREGNYRQVENNFTCGSKPKRTFVKIPYYNKLSKCYDRCSACDEWGNGCIHNCTACRDPSIYGLVPYSYNLSRGNCERYTHKCKGLPYYHDYDLAEKKGIDEDNCEQECDVCLENGTCTENFPFFDLATRECIESCPLNQILAQTCLMNHTNAGFILLENPFDLQDKYAPINQTININQIISSSIFQTFAQKHNINVTNVNKQINNVLGNGEIFNLPESQIIIGNNISIELTTAKLELEKLEKIIKAAQDTTNTEKVTTPNSIIDISECESILKKKYGLSDKEDLMIIKGDMLKQFEQFFGTQVEYQIFSTSLGAFLPLNDCKKADTKVTISNPFNISWISSAFQSKVDTMVGEGYDFLDSDSPFYNDVCTPFTNENGNDVLLDERKTDYFLENINICENGCQYIGYNSTTKLYSCSCPIKDAVNKNEANIITKELSENFYKKHKNSNIEVFKCASQVFSSKGQSKNFGSYTLLVCLTSFIGVVVFYFLKGSAKINELFTGLSILPSNPPKPSPIELDNNPKSSKEISKAPGISDIQKDVVIKDEDLNSANFEIAKEKDQRGFLSYYWSLIKLKQLCIFTFYTSNDNNLRFAKISLFILFISFYFAFTALFFNDSIMRAIYIYKGNTDAAVHVPNIILSSLSCIIMSFIVRLVSLSERDISKIKYENNHETRRALIEKTKRIMKIKLAILFFVSGLLIALCWYYVSAFCAVFKNSQGHYFINVLVAFIICNIWPFVTSLIAPIFRLQGLKNNSPCMYKASQIIAYI